MQDMEDMQDPYQFVEGQSSGGNLAANMDKAERDRIGQEVIANYNADRSTMADWLNGVTASIDMVDGKAGAKTYPFVGASNIRYPVILTAAMQFNARAYPTVVPSEDVVKAKTFGQDPTGQKAERADRVSKYMSWQLVYDAPDWERDTDRLTLQLPVVGDVFRKVSFDGDRALSRLIAPGKLIANDNCSSIDVAPRITEELPDMFPHEIDERVRDGRFIEIEYGLTAAEKESEQPPQQFLEQHARFDLDKDGYPEPYIVTVHRETTSVVRIVADFDHLTVDYETGMTGEFGLDGMPVARPTKIKKIARKSYFVHYQFLPSPKGKLFGLGLGRLLSDITAGINSAFNMIYDAGHYASLGGGFIGTRFRVKGAASRPFRPGEWRHVDADGADIRQSMVSMTYPGPDQTMFAVLGMLMDAAKEVSSTQDVLTGDANTANMQPTTLMAMIEQGLKVFTAAYKRLFLGLRKEYGLIAAINARHLGAAEYTAFHDAPDGQMFDPAQDFSAQGMDIAPVADPNATTKMQQMAKAQLLMDMAGKGMINPEAAAMRVLEAADIPERENLMPQPDPAAQQAQMMAAQMQMEQMRLGLMQAQADIELTLAKVEDARASAMKDMANIEQGEERTRLDAIKIMLEAGRDEAREAIERSRRGMEATPRHAETAIPAYPPDRSPAEAFVPQVSQRSANGADAGGFAAGGPPVL